MDKSELLTTAELAHIELNEGELDTLAGAVAQMVEYFSMMDSFNINTENSGHHIRDGKNHLRKDAASESLLSDDILEQSPDLEDRYISIPNVL